MRLLGKEPRPHGVGLPTHTSRREGEEESRDFHNRGDGPLAEEAETFAKLLAEESDKPLEERLPRDLLERVTAVAE
jgi:hypothetical protein